MRIIAVDDEKIALEGLVDSIKEAVGSAEVTGFRRAEEALQYAKKSICEIAFLDIEMRDMGGLELAERLKKYNPGINIIFTTGYSEYTKDAIFMHVSGYILKPVTTEKIMHELDNLRYPVKNAESKVKVCTFGSFEVYIDEKPIKFKYQKTKELLAYLVDRKGALCTNGELIGILWQDKEELSGSMSYFKNIRADLINTLSLYGCEDIMIRQRGCLGVAVDKISCDYYEWLAKNPAYSDAYRGEYMYQYSWSEFTNGSLQRKEI